MMTSRTLLARAALGGLLLASGCAQLRAANATPPVPMDGQLQATLAQADAEAVALRFGVADRLLADFADAHANTPEAVETQFWRAVFRLNPQNQAYTTRDAVALLDAYLNEPVTVAHRGAALGLRRLAVAPDRAAAATTSVTAAPTAPSTAPSTSPPGRDEEMQRLKDELAKANAELDRIRKRLSQPNP